jgi:hypothetical protein
MWFGLQPNGGDSESPHRLEPGGYCDPDVNPPQCSPVVRRISTQGQESSPSSAKLDARRSISTVIPLLVVLAIVLLVYRPTLASLTNTLPWNLGDPALNTWILAWESHALVQDLGNFFQGNILHPYGDAIKYSEIMLPLVPLFGSVTALTGNPILAHNISILCLAVFCVVTTYLLARRLVGPLAATVAAVSFSFSGYVFMHQGHLQLLTLGFFPLGLLVLLRTLENRRWSDGVWLGICTALLTTGSFYYGAVWLVILTSIVLVDLMRLRKPDREWWRAMGLAAATTAVLVGPVAFVYSAFQREVAFARDVGGLGLNPIDFLTPAPGSLLYEGLFQWAGARQPTGVVEHGFFLGFVIMTLALVGVVLYLKALASRHRRSGDRNRYEMGLLAVSGVVSLALALGPEVMGLPMPFRLFSELVPGFDGIRAASRLAVPALLTVAVFASWGLQRLLVRVNAEQGLVIVAIVASAVLLEMWVEPIRVEPGDQAPVRQVLAAAQPGAVVELPMRPVADSEYAFIEGSRMLDSIGDWRPRFNGYSGGLPPGYMEEIGAMLQFPGSTALDRLAELGIRYVLLHGSDETSDSGFSLQRIDEIVNGLPSTSSFIQTGDAWLVDLTPDQ